MASKQARPHSPAGTRLEPPDEGGIYRIIVPSESRPGKEHTLRVVYTGEALDCSCEGHAAFSRCGARKDCWHMEAAADLLAHHLDPTPADPGGAALDMAQAVVSAEIAEWTATMPATRRLDVRVAATNGAWIQSYTAAGVRLTCTACHDVRGWATEAGAADWLVADGRCGCHGLAGKPRPAQARRPAHELLADLYGPEVS